jgi:hypothetical protein
VELTVNYKIKACADEMLDEPVVANQVLQHNTTSAASFSPAAAARGGSSHEPRRPLLLRAFAATPANPVPSRITVVGSGTGSVLPTETRFTVRLLSKQVGMPNPVLSSKNNAALAPAGKVAKKMMVEG